MKSEKKTVSLILLLVIPLFYAATSCRSTRPVRKTGGSGRDTAYIPAIVVPKN